jgi:hypothetical protein
MDCCVKVMTAPEALCALATREAAAATKIAEREFEFMGPFSL